MNVAQLVHPPAAILPPETNVEEVTRKLRLGTCVAIVDAGRFVGLLDESDVLRSSGHAPLDWIGHHPHLAPDASLLEALASMESAEVAVLPVVEDGTLKGVVELRAVAREIARTYGDAAELRDSLTPQVNSGETIREILRKVRQFDATHELAANVGHDINNLLAVIAFMASPPSGMLRFREDDPELAAELLDCIDECKALAHKFLEFSRHGGVVDGTGDLRAALEQSARFITRGTPVRLELEIQDGLPVPAAGLDGVSRILCNLMVNAVHAVWGAQPSAAIRLEARRCPPGDGDDCIELIVRDNGSGVAPQVATRVFEPRFSTKPGALGLGLTVARGIAQAHRGDVRLDPVLHGGTQATVWLPVAG